MSLNGSNNEEKIWNFLMDFIKNPYGVSGMMGNLYHESALNPKNLQNTFNNKLNMSDEDYTKSVDNGTYANFVRDGAGYGLAQWTWWSRKQNMLNFHKSAGKSIGDLETQLEFLKKELTESYKSILEQLKTATSVLQASNVVLLQYERPANQGIEVQEKRAKSSQTYYDKYAKTGGNTMADFIVAIDAGHGSNTAGKRTPDGYREHWINVRCADYCEDALVRSGIKVVKIAWDDENSKDDEDTALGNRQQAIKNAGCIVSVSFHANAHGDGSEFTSASGVETLIHNNASLVGDSRALATKIQNYLIQGTSQKNRGVKEQSLAMCNCVACGTKASALVEIGFMTNKVEAELMKTEAFCKEQAEEVAHGICDYLGVTYKSASSAPATPAPAPSTPAENKTQKINPLSGTLKVIYNGADGLNVRTAPCMGNNVDQVVRGGTYTVVGISEDKDWYKLKSGLYITTNSKYVQFTETKETAKPTTPSQSGVPYMVRVDIADLNIRKTPSAKDSSNKLGKFTGKGSFTIVEEATGPVNAKGTIGKWGLLKSYQKNRNGWICLDVDGVKKC